MAKVFWIWADCLLAGLFIGVLTRVSTPLEAAISGALAGGSIGLAICWIIEALPLKKKQ